MKVLEASVLKCKFGGIALFLFVLTAMPRTAHGCVQITTSAAFGRTLTVHSLSMRNMAIGLQQNKDDPSRGNETGADKLVIMPSGLAYIVTRHGTGRQLQDGDVVLAHVTGLLANGTEFRRTPNNREVEPVWLSRESNVPGIIEGMEHLNVGDQAILIIPPKLAFGDHDDVWALHGTVGIPSNSTLVYFVEIADVKSNDVAKILEKTIESRGVNAALQQYADLKSKGFPDVYHGEESLNGLGFYLLDDKADPNSAIRIFRINCDEFPQSANVYDSLGEAYARKGDKERAIESYRKALTIDPKFPSSVKALQKLTVN
ncbi:MAG TPA: FKBP-type peptidyl-prolyl cis-trans isomerase [Terracidiphilus sp.]|jgi:FKBP-type peptidyl-prolyl cis-trans isomerase